jgi:tRNA threonylcarbamoyladenosine biosynthesis protein TsaB
VRLLAVDTTTPRGSVALVSEAGVEAEARVGTAEGHSRWLLPAVDVLLRGLDVRAGDLDAFAVTVGPGSFTGLRVGLSSVQGLALACGRPCIGVSALDVLASAAAGSAPAVVALMDAFRGELYSAVYDGHGGLRVPARVGAIETLLPGLPKGVAFVGDATEAHRERILAGVPDAAFPAVDLFLAAQLGRLALRLGPAAAVPAAELRPLYLRAADIRKPRP